MKARDSEWSMSGGGEKEGWDMKRGKSREDAKNEAGRQDGREGFALGAPARSALRESI